MNCCEKFFVLVVIYFPTSDELSVIKDLLNPDYELIVFDNTSNKDKANRNKASLGEEITYFSDNQNIGLSGAYNFIFRTIPDGSWLLLLDQDSCISRASICKLFSFANNVASDVGLISANVVYSRDTPTLSYSQKTSEVKWAISSGSLIAKSAFVEIGGFDNRFFIDRVDYEFCVRLRAFNYHILQLNDCILYQSLGYNRNFGFFHFIDHSPIRYFYIVRNMLLFEDLHGTKVTFFLSYVKIFFKIIKIILFLEDKNKKIRYCLQGIRAFHAKEFGALEDG